MNFSAKNLRLPSARILQVVAAAALAMGSIASFIFAFYYIESASARAVSAEAEAKTVRLRGEKLDASKRLMTVREEDLAKLDSYVLNRSSIAAFIERLEDLSVHAGVTLDIREAKAEDGLTLSFSTDGPFSNTYYFLTLLERLPFNITLKSANFDAAQGSAPGVRTRWHANYSIIVNSFHNG
jgi:hypothetical protein